jgi:hypothetical protein
VNPAHPDTARLRTAIEAYIAWQYRERGASRFTLTDLRAALAATKPTADDLMAMPKDEFLRTIGMGEIDVERLGRALQALYMGRYHYDSLEDWTADAESVLATYRDAK